VAAEKAIEFAKVVIIDRDFEKASKFLPVSAKNRLPSNNWKI
jgi:hypothetical protein